MIKEKINIVISGVGGQGILTLSEIIGTALLLKGYNVKGTEVHGLAQRGGIVTSHVKAAKYEISPTVAPGTADLIIGTEAIETLRLARYINDKTHVIFNTKIIRPSIPKVKLPELDEIFHKLKELTSRVYPIKASEIAIRIGSERFANAVLLGAVTALGILPVTREELLNALAARFSERYLSQNIKAFESGYNALKTLLKK